MRALSQLILAQQEEKTEPVEKGVRRKKEQRYDSEAIRLT
jgi:hypothetical protein